VCGWWNATAQETPTQPVSKHTPYHFSRVLIRNESGGAILPTVDTTRSECFIMCAWKSSELGLQQQIYAGVIRSSAPLRAHHLHAARRRRHALIATNCPVEVE